MATRVIRIACDLVAPCANLLSQRAMRRARREAMALSPRKPRFAEGHPLGDFIPVLCANVLPLWAMWMFDWSLGRFLICFWFELACIVVVASALVGGAVALRMLMASAAFLAVSLACVVALALDPQEMHSSGIANAGFSAIDTGKASRWMQSCCICSPAQSA